MKEITINDVILMKEKFLKYCQNAEQERIPFLVMVTLMVDETIRRLEQDGGKKDKKQIAAMMRCLLMIMGEDYSEYVEETFE